MKSSLLPVLIITALLAGTGAAESGGMLEVTADIRGVDIFVDGLMIGQAPVTLIDLEDGTHQVRAEATGYDPLIRTVSIPHGGGEKIRFEFIPDSPEKIPGQIRIEDCVGTPEMTSLSGTSVDILGLPDGSRRVFYSGHGQGIITAVMDEYGKWIENPDPVLTDAALTGSALPPTGPWVFPVGTGYRLIYQQFEGTKGYLMSAYSPDGEKFTPEGPLTFRWQGMDTEVIQPSMPSGFNRSDGSLFMFYTKGKEGISSATSADGGKSWDFDHDFLIPGATDPSAVLLPDGSAGIFYTDLTQNFKGQRIWFRHAGNPGDLEKAEPVLVLEVGEPGVWLLDPDIYQDGQGRWTLFFSIFGGYDRESGLSEPAIMQAVIDPRCLVTRATHTSAA